MGGKDKAKAAESKQKRRDARKSKEAKKAIPDYKKVLFKSIVPEEKHSDDYKTTRLAGYAPAVQMMERCFRDFDDKDGNFLEQFQTTGFDSRVWELYLHTYLTKDGFEIDSTNAAPDFCVCKNKQVMHIEAVTTSKSQKGALAGLILGDSIKEKSKFQAIKMGSALWSKLCKKYWDLEHVKQSPLVFALECFHEDGPVYWGDAPLIDYLYGKTFSWHYDDDGTLVIKNHDEKNIAITGKDIPSGFFQLPGSENVSAVIFSNCGTVTKFARMAKQKWPSYSHVLIRRGTMYNHTDNATMPRIFKYVVGATESPHETWGSGLTMFHNPNALHPVDASLFPGIPHGYFRDGVFVIVDMPAFHPLGSVTQILYTD